MGSICESGQSEQGENPVPNDVVKRWKGLAERQKVKMIEIAKKISAANKEKERLVAQAKKDMDAARE